MAKKEVTAVFDIGKTNKKFFLFDDDFQEVYREYAQFDKIKDEDGHPTEDLQALQNWLKKVFNDILQTEKFHIQAINFSSYGASFVHIDKDGTPLTPLYNYTKQIDQKYIDEFYNKYGPELDFTRVTGSPKSGMLNSGMQLYWLKYAKPEVFASIRYSLHLPQYLSYVFTSLPISEYTSIGCHTSLWNYGEKDYHHWVYEEGIDEKFPPIVSTETSINMNYNGYRMKIGVGIHDSSAALLPYIRSSEKPFVLVSTGTWNVAMNPFSKKKLTEEEVQNGCLNYMRINGNPVKASRLMLGREFDLQVRELTDYYGVAPDYYKNIEFDYDIYLRLTDNFTNCFKWKTVNTEEMPAETNLKHSTFEEAYHQFMIEIVRLQIDSIKSVLNDAGFSKLYVDGGFSDNQIYLQLLSHYLRNLTLRTTNSSIGSALGAAISISDKQLNSKFLKKNYSLKKHVPFIIK